MFQFYDPKFVEEKKFGGHPTCFIVKCYLDLGETKTQVNGLGMGGDYPAEHEANESRCNEDEQG